MRGDEVIQNEAPLRRRKEIWSWLHILLTCVAVSCAVAGCVSTSWYRHQTRLDAELSPSSNRGRAVAVDLVAAYEKAVVDTLGSTPARQWFDGKRSWLKRQYPNGFQRWHWEWASGQGVPPKVLSMPARTEGVYIFASYEGAGPHRTRVARLRDIELFLGETSFQARPRP